MKRIALLVASAAILAAGCVTETTGERMVPASAEESSRLNMELGIGYLNKGDLDQALVKLQKSIKENPENATAHRVLGVVYEALGDGKQAEKEYRTAVRMANCS